MSNFNVDSFTSKLKQGGALGSLFECELTGSKGTEAMTAIGDFKFMCKGVTFPASTIEAATVTYMGRPLQIPGNRAAAQVTTEIYNDEKMEIRNHIESWMERLNSHKTNKRQAGFEAINSYTGTMKVSQLSKVGTATTKSYEFIDVWPSSTGEITLSWDTNDIQTFSVIWEFSYWKSRQSNVGFS